MNTQLLEDVKLYDDALDACEELAEQTKNDKIASISTFENVLKKQYKASGLNAILLEGYYQIYLGLKKVKVVIKGHGNGRESVIKTLSNLGLKVSAVSLMCQDEATWEAMEMAASPCPFGGALGDVARRAWFKRYPERFYKLYGSDFKLPVIADKQ